MDGDRVEYCTRDAKGKTIAGGVSGIIELISPNRVSKTPWPGSEESLCRQELQLEASVYRIVGPHERLVRFFGQDPRDGSITLEYMPVGTLRDYLKSHNANISMTQRLRWALEATEGLKALHSSHIIHCDFSPRNLLLTETLDLKVADFGGCSINGSLSSAEGSVRFYPPRRHGTPPTFDLDIFALGSTIYEIMTGKAPYEEIASDRVIELYGLSQFPVLHEVLGAGIIRDCWLCNFQSAHEVYLMLRSIRL